MSTGTGRSESRPFPSRKTGIVPLSEVEAVVRDGNGGDSERPVPVLTLRLEAGAAENADVRVTFEDVDGDGKVSTGDRLTLVKKTDAASGYSVALRDEATDLYLAPGWSAAAAALAGLAAAFALARRGRA